MKRTAFLACALVAVCASFAHAESPAASAGPSVDVIVSPFDQVPALDVAVIQALQLADATVFVAGMSGGYTLLVIDAASHFATSSSAHAAANDPHAGFDMHALYSPPLYEAAPPWTKAIGKRTSRHARQTDRWRI